MAFESLSHFHELKISDFPREWLPLTYLYDPDLPLFPLLYIHVIDPNLAGGHRPGHRDRLYGFIHHCNLQDDGLEVTVVVNKNLDSPHNAQYVKRLEHEIRSRLGLVDPVTLNDLKGCLRGRLASANKLVEELWYKIIDGSFGKALPFGPNWDPVFGLIRFVASFYSAGGRKGELIQTHDFCSHIGVRISTSSDIHADFYLLPTFEEMADQSNPLNLFSDFAELVRGADEFVADFCGTRTVESQSFSEFDLKSVGAGKYLNKEVILSAIESLSANCQQAMFESYTAFDRGPLRSVIFFMMLHDLRNGLWDPKALNPRLNGALYPGLKRSYQTPKVIQLYVQQCFGNVSVLPIDNWVETFLDWPLGFQASKKKNWHAELFETCDVWGKLERLIWVAAQSRKVHSSVCADILWCVRYGKPKQEKSPGLMRGANPLACKVCELHIRDVCPGYARIKDIDVLFNVGGHTPKSDRFCIETSAGENVTKGQTLLSVSGCGTADIYTTRDRSAEFLKFPVAGHSGERISVEEFVAKY